MGAENIIVSSSVLLLCIQCYCAIPSAYCAIPSAYCAIPSAYCAIPVPTMQFLCLLCKHGMVGTGVPRLFTCAHCIVAMTFAFLGHHQSTQNHSAAHQLHYSMDQPCHSYVLKVFQGCNIWLYQLTFHLTAEINYRQVCCKNHPSRATSKSGTGPRSAFDVQTPCR